MPKFAFTVLLGLAACAASDASSGPVEMEGWRMVSGKPPTRAEYVAVVAACQDGMLRRAAGPLNACLAELGLKRVQ
jgi:hypothetical protein